MSTTLTNGLKLPDKGSVDWYADMQNNYSILDGAVGTVAEHTTALSGKAPLVHTHSKADITDFPAYGNTAGTICEGNDSRLSDARTPVAHTHGKSDVTDLFNSANTWSGNNSYTGTVSLDSSSDVAEQFKQKLPKDVSTSNDAMARVNSLVDSAGHYVVVETLGHWSNYVAKNITLKYKNDSAKQRAIEFRLYSDGTGIFYAQSPFACDLGNSYNKWKTLNGINPGALSLPDYDSADPINFSQWDVTGAVGVNYYTPTVNGWLNISIWDRATNSIFVYRSGKERVGVFGNGSMAADGRIALLMPVKANATYTIIIKANANSDIYSAIFFPCLGNV